VFVLILIPHYSEIQAYPGIITRTMEKLDLNRHAFERILFLAPIIWSGFLFGWKGSVISSLFALICMLPRAFLISSSPLDAVFESCAVFVVGNAVSFSFASLRKERDYRMRLETAQQKLIASEHRYRQLFENAHDPILIHNLEGDVIAVNSAGEKLTGYTSDELLKMNVKQFLSEVSSQLAGQIRRKLIANEPVDQIYEQRLIKKDGSEVIVQLATSLLYDKDKPTAFQNIARDITEEKRMQENLRHYLRQVTKAQEEERKRISRELHDETIQDLIVLSRQLDQLASNTSGLSTENRLRLEELWQQTDTIIRGIRRLSQDLRPAALDRLGLLPALELLATESSEYSGIKTNVELVGSERRLPEETELVLFRVTQEALRNVWKHSGASETNIKADFNDTSIKIIINDNGKGFDLPGKIGDLARYGKLGLAGMQERAQLIGGNLTMESHPGKGTTVIIEVPIPA
jgi:two-component system sensor histidine kinase DegS